MMRGCHVLMLAAIVTLAVVSAARSDDAGPQALADSFDAAGSVVWQPFPTSVAVEGGVATIAPPTGQQWLTSAARFQYGELEMTVRFNRLSDDSSLFYYLGFQNLVPWARQVCWLQVQDAQMNIVASKDGANTINTPVLSGLKTEQWYRLKLQWTAAAVVVAVDGRVVFSSAEQRHGLSSAPRAGEIIPVAPMHVFLAANTLSNKQGVASLSLDEVCLTGGRPARVSRQPVTTHTAQLDRDQTVGSPDSAVAELRSGRIRLENAGLACEWDAAAGLAWRQLAFKPKDVALLYESENSPLFIVLGKDFYCDSRDCIIEDVRVTDDGERKSAELALRHADSGLTFRLSASLAAGEGLRLGLRVRNDGQEARRLQTIFPLVGRVRTDGDRRGLRYFYPWRSGIVGDVDAYFMNEYGNLAWLQVMCAFDPASGAALSLYPRDSTGQVKGLVLKKQSAEPGPMVRHCEMILQEEVPPDEPLDFNQGLGMACYSLPRVIAHGEEVELPQASLSVYDGDWKPALSDYTRWLHSWYHHVETPTWFRDCFGFTPAHPPHYYSYEENRYVAAERLRSGDHVLQWAYWDDYVHDPATPADYLEGRVYRPGDFEINRQRGGLATFRQEVQRIRDKGSHVTVYIDHRFCWSQTSTYEAHAQEWAAHYQPAVPGFYRASDEACMCFLEPGAWADYIAATCGRLVRDAGLDGVYLDELNIAFPCYNSAHHHYCDGASPVSAPLLARHVTAVRDAMRRENPQAILMTEHAGSDYMSQFVDGSWVQTYYRDGFPFAEKYFDAESLHYFRFVCPEFKLAEWGVNNDGARRCLFNGIGFIGLDYGGAEDLLQTLRENGDAFATLAPEPHVSTLVPGLLANGFPVDAKLVYTLYNKSGGPVAGEAIEVEALPGWRWVECLSDVEVAAQPVGEGRARLSLNLEAGRVACVSRLERLLSVEKIAAGAVAVSALRSVAPARLVVYLDKDTGLPADGRHVKLSEGRAVVDADQLFGRRGKLILKLLAGAYLVDEVSIAL
jgi:hypothetical protein